MQNSGAGGAAASRAKGGILLKRIWISPPLAFARVGPSTTPCVSFLWGESDLLPRGTGYTTLLPTETLTLAATGAVSAQVPREVMFRDAEGIRPVCPYFELHGEWSDSQGVARQGPLTAALLSEWKLPLAKVNWEIVLGSLKPYHYTYEDSDRIYARAHFSAADNRRKPLLGCSPKGKNALVHAERTLPMGEVQAAKPDQAFPELRMRFYAPKGLIYGPTDLMDRLRKVDYDHENSGDYPNREWRGFALPESQRILNPRSAWATYMPSRAKLGPFGAADARNNPTGLLATVFERIESLKGKPTLQRSLGLVDDVADGIVSCTLRLHGKLWHASARIVIGPPDFAPANRTPVSLADNLVDRVGRSAVRSGRLKDDDLRELVADIFERAFETSQLIHKDYQNRRSWRTNENTIIEQGTRLQFDPEDIRNKMLWEVPSAQDVVSGRMSAMGLVEEGARKHRRYTAIEFLEDRFRENPALLDEWLRRPVDPKPFYDKRMPALMRGSDGRPFHLTRRQWEIVRAWIAQLRKNTTAAGMDGHGQ